MIYKDLKQLGFSEDYSISLNKEDNLSYIRSLSRVPVVYIIKTNKKLVRLKGSSDIIYIGMSGNLRLRIKTLFKDLIPEGYYKISFNHTAREDVMRIIKETDNKLFITYLKHDNPREMESKLLTLYRKHHIESPPLNNQRT
jgi:hypothetical protein